MTRTGWNPWKVTAIGMAAVVVTALVTGLVVANWSAPERDRADAPAPAVKTAGAPGKPVVTTGVPATPSKSAIEACNRYAASEAGDTMVEVGLVGGGTGTLYGLNESRKSDGRYRAAYASCMRSRGYAS